uniref:Uncharacterized protein n=1 Tax=Rhizophora mucronata TaxID=61149 RepID=A0A2P2QJ31_RHIMU
MIQRNDDLWLDFLWLLWRRRSYSYRSGG